MPYQFGSRSRSNLEHVHPALREWCFGLITISPVDFGVYKGSRTIEEQRQKVRNGTSRTMNSKHIIQADGYAHAVDLVPYMDGRYQWLWEPIYEIAGYGRTLAVQMGVDLIWGGCWDRLISQWTDPRQAVKEYAARYRNRYPSRSPLLDGPHYQLAL